MDPTNPLMYLLIGGLFFSALIVFFGSFFWGQLQREKEHERERSPSRSVYVASFDHRTRQAKVVGSTVYLRVPLGTPDPDWRQAPTATVEGITTDGKVKLVVHETRGREMRDATYTTSPANLSHDRVPQRA